jgi:hypothetical protein
MHSVQRHTAAAQHARTFDAPTAVRVITTSGRALKRTAGMRPAPGTKMMLRIISLRTRRHDLGHCHRGVVGAVRPHWLPRSEVAGPDCITGCWCNHDVSIPDQLKLQRAQGTETLRNPCVRLF